MSPSSKLSHCPDCREPLLILEFEGVEMDYCASCSGLWLDAGELEQLTEAAGVAPGTLSRALARGGPGRKGSRACPRCLAKLRVVTVSPNPPLETIAPSPAVEVDCCPHGHGLWLDRGEVRAIVAGFGGEGESGAVAQFLANLSGDRRLEAEG